MINFSHKSLLELSGRVLDLRRRGWGGGGRASPASLRCGPCARHIYPSLNLVQPRKTRPCLTERLLMGRKNQTKQTQEFINFMFTTDVLISEVTSWQNPYCKLYCTLQKARDDNDDELVFNDASTHLGH